MSRQVEAWIGLGSNLEEPLQQLASAVTGLAMLPRTTLLSQSPFYRSRPMGPQDQPDFVNGVALLQTSLPAESLLDELQQLEQQHGRVRERHWGPRTLDLDLLLYGRETLNTERLTVPHPGIPDRDFVLRPMLDINPGVTLPDGRRIDELLALCTDSHLQRLEPPLASSSRHH
ncbi:2-amino-4-hydroxy-6-hydroxymethyldihydropteridine diphosphokinase [Marinobacter zhanjiangensis]|uniref:2-amino-4-hydroxy-6-hydroxymethyldihydropteridine pyrophosphokinase n=1 Tax=Marinobacter zhanjiangensis TaxID=578215 RepID=A0ABQ3B8J0_9GAMM|nr:2-amino-4-hydroxy-6-hydroxymethyldihydropteridine diphosphokinase [Marinobacter zhanjiangensis]GGY83446.1 2-amino-4-hydroxy-6-hydroxymethyldihydropteridine diphosphokinase [Marinobacter zhanjiangensis]